MKVLTVDYRSPMRPSASPNPCAPPASVLTHHPIPKELVQSIYDNWYRFFMSEQKQDFLFNRETQDGYSRLGVRGGQGPQPEGHQEYSTSIPGARCRQS
jgi:hypothetical protein